MFVLTFLLPGTTFLSLAALGLAIRSATVEMQFGLVRLPEAPSQMEKATYRMAGKASTRY